ncbi:(2Fe-2S)-binding protein [Sulfitobacter sp. CW3]|nr:(2Fe-2S)-binding protein [Sulfitobacter sp. CW3]
MTALSRRERQFPAGPRQSCCLYYRLAHPEPVFPGK